MRTLLRPLFFVLIVMATTIAPTAATADSATRVKHWKITASSVGPLHLGGSFADITKAGYSHSPCGQETGGHPCYFRGKLGKVMQFDVDANDKISQFMVNAANGHGFAFATSNGVTVGSTVKDLKEDPKAKSIGNYGYGEAFQLHPRKNRFVTFFCTGEENTATVYSISVSTKKKPAQGR